MKSNEIKVLYKMQNFILFKINNWSERDFFISITLVKNTAFASRWDRKFLPRSNYVFPVCSLKKSEGNRILKWRTKRRRNSPSKSIEETYAKRSWLLLQSPVYFLISLDFPVKWYIYTTLGIGSVETLFADSPVR